MSVLFYLHVGWDSKNVSSSFRLGTGEELRLKALHGLRALEEVLCGRAPRDVYSKSTVYFQGRILGSEDFLTPAEMEAVLEVNENNDLLKAAYCKLPADVCVLGLYGMCRSLVQRVRGPGGVHGVSAVYYVIYSATSPCKSTQQRHAG